ncbi:hypothetical protein ALP90_100728 [Pseudomonas amygdali pv. ulmi]|uniref:Uncharacterized protein n=1 Tax=Pseudomonas amygdali pv. ulmi TaxID=251720 RepID=A0A3M4SXI0_PSEA0|nr:hypothetical protein [Pseudomonas amygdali]RMR19638.1 hypothetical protein ALP90_100728 [Pseudomonas amygdali pv. ulmi]
MREASMKALSPVGQGFQMKTIQKKAVAEDLRKIGSTAIAAALISIFVTNFSLLSACAMVVRVVMWLLGIFMTKEE